MTDPPYYDAVSYTDLSSLDYLWLRRSIGYLFPDAFASHEIDRQDDLFVASAESGRAEEARSAYLQRTLEALCEAYRVLKPDRLMGIVLRSKDGDQLQGYLDNAQIAGFSLHRVVPYSLPGLPGAEKTENRVVMRSLLLILRKDPLSVRLDHAIADAATVIRLAESDSPSLYDALAGILLEQLSEEDIDDLVPKEFAGSSRQRLAEYVATCENLEHVLVRAIGLTGLRKAARARGLESAGQPETIATTLLHSVGFHVPPAPGLGVVDVIKELRLLASEAEAAASLPLAQSALTRGMARVEAVLKHALWAWSRRVFGADAGSSIEKLAQQSAPDRRLHLLTMGNIKYCFAQLPDYVIRSGAAENVQREFGRPHLYLIGKTGPVLDSLVNIRNKVQHNKDGYLDVTSFPTLRAEFTKALKDAADVLQQLVDRRAIPLLVRPVTETRDQYGRVTVRLNIEDGTVRDIYPADAMVLGQDYYYLGHTNNPRPVGPVMVRASEVRDAIV